MMKKILQFFNSLLQWGRGLLVQKKWWVTPLLIALLAGAYIVLYLVRYKRTEFLYTLF